MAMCWGAVDVVVVMNEDIWSGISLKPVQSLKSCDLVYWGQTISFLNSFNFKHHDKQPSSPFHKQHLNTLSLPAPMTLDDGEQSPQLASWCKDEWGLKTQLYLIFIFSPLLSDELQIDYGNRYMTTANSCATSILMQGWMEIKTQCVSSLIKYVWFFNSFFFSTKWSITVILHVWVQWRQTFTTTPKHQHQDEQGLRHSPPYLFFLFSYFILLTHFF